MLLDVNRSDILHTFPVCIIISLRGVCERDNLEREHTPADTKDKEHEKELHSESAPHSGFEGLHECFRKEQK